MAQVHQSQALTRETIEQVDEILKKLFNEGQRWLKSVAKDDPRRMRYISSRPIRDANGPSTTYVAKDIQPVTNYLKKTATKETGATHTYLVVKPDSPCLDEKVVALVRPVLKTNLDEVPCLNFHVWFHHLATDGHEHFMVGWRLEGPEGNNTSHDYFHAQPLKKFGEAESIHGSPARQSERFPTIPLPVEDIVELCLTVVLMASGKEALRSLVCASTNKVLRDSARKYWTKVFSTPFPIAH